MHLIPPIFMAASQGVSDVPDQGITLSSKRTRAWEPAGRSAQAAPPAAAHGCGAVPGYRPGLSGLVWDFFVSFTQSVSLP